MGGTSDFNPADVEGFSVLDEVRCHRAVLTSVNGQLGEILKLLSMLSYRKHTMDWNGGYHFAVSACVVAVVVCRNDTRQIDFARLDLLLEHRQYAPINLG